MDHQEEHNSELTGETRTPEDARAAKSSSSQAASSESPAEESPSGKSRELADDQPEHSPANNHANSQALPDDAGQLKNLVKERDKVIGDLRARNSDLQQKLNEKEKIVTALTSRLEQAAEQLDRLHRSGADRHGKILSGIPAEVIDEQRELINDLKAAIQHWEELQSTSAMGRFEAQLGELREMLAEQLDLKDRIDKGGKTSAFTSGGTSASPVTQRSSWDEMKAQLLRDSSASSTRKDDSDVLVPGAELSGLDDEEEARDGRSAFEEKYESEYVIEIPDRPAEINNIDKADADTLRAAVKERDEHIDKLMEVIDALKDLSGQDEFEHAKLHQKALEERLKKAEAEMREKLRQAEIEMSMERAKVAREAARLQQLSSGGSVLPDANGAEQAAEEAPSEDKGSRWARFLGSK